MPAPFDPSEVEDLRAEIDAKSKSYGPKKAEPTETAEERHLRLQAEQGHTASVTPMPVPSRRGDKAQHILESLEEDEPFFIFRAKDIFSIMVLANYAEIIEKYGPDDADFHRDVIDQLLAFKHWQRNNVEKVRYPD